MPHPLPEGITGVFRLIEATNNDRQQALVALMGLCGCRVAEALQVVASDFDLHNMTLTIHGKGDKERIVPVSSRAWEVLAVPLTKALLEGRPVVNMPDRFARRVITRLGSKAGLARPISSHDLRATFATAVYNKTRDLRVTQELCGHASSHQTELYTLVAPETMAAAVEL